MKRILPILSVAGLAIAGCAGNALDTYRQDLNKRWTLSSLTQSGKEITLNNEIKQKAFVQFEATGVRFNGNAGCNNFFGGYEISKENEVSFGNAGMTRMMCDPASMKVEDTLIKILNDGVSQAIIKGGQLTISRGDITATFTQAK
ncbi:hypothetical protein CCZ01_05955 [Helicobacter monodelphidis]|uniref:META domain-containing protein n=1 Tax=Helicobacter sp. 15-1451 TaxID=2004995 RepID=UPI000DCDBA25|nr:META domain-containing protein [Helicobacter sp. 15-1451]RAX57524.1 hypothetical protein CCZ01_05955 [Helicobacter sp. 15-1451]